jgi:hypothetical protein
VARLDDSDYLPLDGDPADLGRDVGSGVRHVDTHDVRSVALSNTYADDVRVAAKA